MATNLLSTHLGLTVQNTFQREAKCFPSMFFVAPIFPMIFYPRFGRHLAAGTKKFFILNKWAASGGRYSLLWSVSNSSGLERAPSLAMLNPTCRRWESVWDIPSIQPIFSHLWMQLLNQTFITSETTLESLWVQTGQNLNLGLLIKRLQALETWKGQSQTWWLTFPPEIYFNAKRSDHRKKIRYVQW